MKKLNHFFTIGITGHRDLLQSELGKYKDELRNYFSGIKAEKEIVLLSPLADGADRLFIEVGIELGLRYKTVLPMPIEEYSQDFSKESLQEFYSLYLGASGKEILPWSGNRNEQYRAVGEYIAKESDVLVAMWDGESGKYAGTGDIVKFRTQNLHAPYYHIPVHRSVS
jgi:hypothetical protein